MIWKNRSCRIFLAALIFGAVQGTSSLRAEEVRPALDAELLMARYWSGGMGAIFGVPDMPSKSLDFALYSDGTILLSAKLREIGALPGFKIGKISSETARQRYAEFLAAFHRMNRSYTENCWIRMPDGSKRGFACASDAYTANIALIDPSSGGYLTVSVYDAAHWKELPEIMDFVPAKYFELMAWMDALQEIHSTPWVTQSFMLRLNNGSTNHLSGEFLWPTTWPKIPGPGQAVCVLLDQFSPVARASLPVTLGNTYVEAANERLIVEFFDVYLPGLLGVGHFQRAGFTRSCP
jgi:hypothetical protein